MKMTSDEFMELFSLGGQLKACNYIFEVLNNDDLSADEKVMELAKYNDECKEAFKKLRLKWNMAKGEIDWGTE